MRQVFDGEAAVTPTSTISALDSGPTLGIVDPVRARDSFALARVEPASDLADLVDWHWVISWDLPPGVAFTQTVMPHPVGHVVAEREGLLAYAMPAGLFVRTLTGSGAVVGTKLHPGAYRALLGRADPGERGTVEPPPFSARRRRAPTRRPSPRRRPGSPTSPSGPSPRCCGKRPSGPGPPAPPPRSPG
ncbi:DUF6597 domain-containing transcriptional factor [Promicromonospora sp. NPDC050262]|uniref:DUF6597 domain-containing transcriptional factor n=1 Tax=Promicromonospora sp. NPDC050262 TaxID=3155036 RepID=UPI003404C028